MSQINLNDLVQDLRDEADLCRNETATDIADLLEEAACCIAAIGSQFKGVKAELAAAQEALDIAKHGVPGPIAEQGLRYLGMKAAMEEAQEARQRAEDKLEQSRKTNAAIKESLYQRAQRAEALAESYRTLLEETLEVGAYGLGSTLAQRIEAAIDAARKP